MLLLRLSLLLKVVVCNRENFSSEKSLWNFLSPVNGGEWRGGGMKCFQHKKMSQNSELCTPRTLTFSSLYQCVWSDSLLQICSQWTRRTCRESPCCSRRRIYQEWVLWAQPGPRGGGIHISASGNGLSERIDTPARTSVVSVTLVVSSYVASCEMPLRLRCQASITCDWPRGIKGNMTPGQSHHAGGSTVARYTWRLYSNMALHHYRKALRWQKLPISNKSHRLGGLTLLLSIILVSQSYWGLSETFSLTSRQTNTCSRSSQTNWT